MSDIRKCEVCGKERQVYVRASACGPISFAYCEDCLKCGAEPYKALIAYLSCAGIMDTTELDKRYVQNVVEPTLRVANKNNADLEADLKKESEEMDRYYAEMNAIALREQQEARELKSSVHVKDSGCVKVAIQGQDFINEPFVSDDEPNIEKFTSDGRLETLADVDKGLLF